jgi:hypothetical protein
MRMRDGLLAMALWACAPAAALAQQGPSNKQADEQFDKARAEMDQAERAQAADPARATELYRQALGLLRSSHGLEPGRGKLLNIAVCEEHLGMLGSAYNDYREVAVQLPKGDPRGTLVAGALAKLAPRVPYLRIDLAATAPAGATVTIDGVAVEPAALGTDMPVDPGKRAILVRAPGRLDKLHEVTLDERKRVTIAVDAGPFDAGSATPIASVPDGAAAQKRSSLPAFVLGGVGVAGLGLGGLLIGLREGKRAEAGNVRAQIRDHLGGCVPGTANFDEAGCATLHTAAVTADTFGVVSAVGFAAGGVALGAMAAYLLWPARKVSPGPGVSMQLYPAIDAHGQGVFAAGSF